MAVLSLIQIKASPLPQALYFPSGKAVRLCGGLRLRGITKCRLYHSGMALLTLGECARQKTVPKPMK